MAIRELRERLAESKGTKSDKRIVILESIFEEVKAIEGRAVKDPFSISLEELRDLRALVPDLEAAINRARAGIKRMTAA
jgi:hypothetical protein